MDSLQALCTVLVSSCDGYEELWRPFFTLLHRQWPEMPFEAALCTESKNYTGPYAPQLCLHPQRPDVAWTTRLRQCLAQLKTPYVLLLLDDFFFTGPVDGERVVQCLRWMQQDADVACFSFYPTTGNLPADYPGFEKRPQNGLYRFNAQAGLWRTAQLMEFLCEDEDAWQWENQGNLRSFSVTQAFYSEKESSDRIFPYDYMRHGLIGGKWFPETKQLFEQYGLQVDFAKRGFYDPARWMFLPSVHSAFSLDSVLYPDTGSGFSEQTALAVTPVIKEGAFNQHFSLPQPSVCSMLRWDPSTRSGFYLKDLAVQVKYTDGTTQAIELPKCSGNGQWVGSSLVFLQPDPQIIFPAHGKKTVVSVDISGTAVCPITEEMYSALSQPAKPGLLRRLAAMFAGRGGK